jgi:hypothetical protein
MTVLIVFALLSFPRRRKSTNLHRTTWRFRRMDPPPSRRMTTVAADRTPPFPPHHCHPSPAIAAPLLSSYPLWVGSMRCYRLCGG